MLVVLRDSNGCSIHEISPPKLPQRTDLDYSAIGSGYIYSLTALTIQLYCKDRKISEALFHVYTAKKAAELVYGVGEQTDMAVVTENGVSDCPPETLSMLEEYRLEKSRYLLTENESNEIRTSLNL